MRGKALISTAAAALFVVLLNCDIVICGPGSDGRRGDLTHLPPLWNTAPPARLTYRNKGDLGDVDPRGSVRYNIGPDGRILRGIITKHREVPADDDGIAIDQAKVGSIFQNSY